MIKPDDVNEIEYKIHNQELLIALMNYMTAYSGWMK